MYVVDFAFEPALMAQIEAKVSKLVVLDHHKAEGALPRVHAAVNPNRLDCASGLRHLCAAAVAFLAVVALHRALRRSGHFARRPEPRLLDLLDLVALATVCDVMPLTGVNRALVAQGLKVMARREGTGMAALIATHNPDLAARMDRVVTLKEGRVVAA